MALASVEYSQTLSFKRKGRGFEFRIFAGLNGELENGKVSSAYFNNHLHMNGQGGYDDFLFDEVFLGRSEREGILSQQFTATQGGFKVATYTGQAQTWLAALNIGIPFPGKIPLYGFGDIGVYDTSIPNSLKTKGNLMYDFGIELRIIPKVFSIYFPLGYSNDVKDVYDNNEKQFGNYLKKIRFELNISKSSDLSIGAKD